MAAAAPVLVGVTVLAGVTLAGAGCGHPAARPAAATCWQSAVRAIERHVTVRSVPASCAGLSDAQLSHVVASAVRAAAGPHPKAAERRIAAADARYLASLVRGGPARAPGAGGAPTAALAPVTPPARPGAGLGLAALGCWTLTAAAGGYLFSGHRRAGLRPRRPPAIAAGHASLAIAGLAVWAAWTAARGSAALGWAAAALVIGTAGLGIAVLLASVLEPATAERRSERSGLAPRRVLAIASHVTLAVVTMLLVLLAATGRS
jgi:hypothetical protein